MSYADLLSQYSNKMSEVRGHAEEIGQSIAQNKAAGLKETYDRALGHLQTASEASAAASGAYMAGRSLYKKFRGQGQAKAKATDDEGGDAEAGGEAGADAGGLEDGASGAGRAVGQGTSEGSGSGASGGAAEAGEGADTISDATQEIGGGSRYQLGDDDAVEGRPTGQAKGDLARNVEAGEDEPAPEVSAEGPTLEGAPAEAVEATAGDATTAANVGQQVGGNIAKSALKTVAKTAGEGIGETAGDAVGAGLASQALDFLGPVGLGIGAVSGLVDLFEGLFGKKPKDAGQQATPLQSEGSGLDVKGLTSQAGPATATLV
jgi:hypothetical protein